MLLKCSTPFGITDEFAARSQHLMAPGVAMTLFKYPIASLGQALDSGRLEELPSSQLGSSPHVTGNHESSELRMSIISKEEHGLVTFSLLEIVDVLGCLNLQRGAAGCPATRSFVLDLHSDHAKRF